MSRVPLGSIRDLEILLGAQPGEILEVSNSVGSMIHVFTRTAKGKARQFVEAKGKLREIHDLIRKNLLTGLSLSVAVHGYVKGHSNVTHARVHAGAKTIGRFDIKNFFPNIAAPRINKIFKELGAGPEVATALTRLTTFRGALPLGFSTSNDLANLVAAHLVHRIEGLAKKHGFHFSVYGDNYEISGEGRVESFRRLIAGIIGQEGFILNKKKSVVLQRNESKEITGVFVNDTPSWGRRRMREIRAEIHRLKKNGPADNVEERLLARRRLRGYAAYVHSINPAQGERILKQLDDLERAQRK